MPDQDKAREQFEAEAHARGWSVGKYPNGLYCDDRAYFGWMAWQAATAAASQDREELVRELEDIRDWAVTERAPLRAQEIRSIDALITKHRS